MSSMAGGRQQDVEDLISLGLKSLADGHVLEAQDSIDEALALARLLAQNHTGPEAITDERVCILYASPAGQEHVEQNRNIQETEPGLFSCH